MKSFRFKLHVERNAASANIYRHESQNGNVEFRNASSAPRSERSQDGPLEGGIRLFLPRDHRLTEIARGVLRAPIGRGDAVGLCVVKRRRTVGHVEFATALFERRVHILVRCREEPTQRARHRPPRRRPRRRSARTHRTPRG